MEIHEIKKTGYNIQLMMKQKKTEEKKQTLSVEELVRRQQQGLGLKFENKKEKKLPTIWPVK